MSLWKDDLVQKENNVRYFCSSRTGVMRTCFVKEDFSYYILADQLDVSVALCPHYLEMVYVIVSALSTDLLV